MIVVGQSCSCSSSSSNKKKRTSYSWLAIAIGSWVGEWNKEGRGEEGEEEESYIGSGSLCMGNLEMALKYNGRRSNLVGGI